MQDLSHQQYGCLLYGWFMIVPQIVLGSTDSELEAQTEGAPVPDVKFVETFDVSDISCPPVATRRRDGGRRMGTLLRDSRVAL